MPPPNSPIPFQIDQRPMPSGEDLETLLPAEVGPFPRSWIDDYDPDDVRNEDIAARYRSGEPKKFLWIFSFSEGIDITVSICDNPEDAREAINVVQADNGTGGESQISLDTEPSFYKWEKSMVWSRANYYFSVSADSKEILDRFMQAFPY